MMEAPCKPEFHEKIKASLRTNFAPDESRYAHIVHDKYGKCTLQRQDGLCGLQIELGEGVLPQVCRLFPRNRRKTGQINECALSCSCEGVVERLLASAEPLRFVTMQIEEAPLFPIDMKPEQLEECNTAISMMQNREKTLPQRFEYLGETMFGCMETCDPEEGKLESMKMLHLLMDACCGKTKVAGTYVSEALRFYGVDHLAKLNGEEAKEMLERYELARQRVFRGRVHWQEHAERLLVNHMFYNSFPHIGGTNDGDRAFYGLCTIWAFVKVVFVGNLSRWETREDQVDLISALGRMIEHSDFKYRATQYYRKYSDRCPGYWRQLTSL